MIKVGIVGGTGYTGGELLRLLVRHPEVEVCAVTSRRQEGSAVGDVWPHLRTSLSLSFCSVDDSRLFDCDVVFFATPNGQAMQLAGGFLDKGVKVVDLSADFRLDDVAEWEKWYGMKHASPHLVEQAVYGLTELHRDQVKSAQLVANPGCYPTSVLLGLLPLLEQEDVSLSQVVVDAKSGVSGAGKQAGEGGLLCEVGESVKAYGVSGHRHWPEIFQGFSFCGAVELPQLTFVPHLVPMKRGIFSSIYLPGFDSVDDVRGLYEQRFNKEFFVDVLPEGQLPQSRSVVGGNFCQIAIEQPHPNQYLAVFVVIDNLVKGAAGQAVQNMNVMFGFDESVGLAQVALVP